MRVAPRKRLEAAGWRFGNYAEFLGLTDVEVAQVELHAALADAVKARRKRMKITQVELAKRLASSQSRVAKMEARDRQVSLDLLIHGLLALGATRKQIGRVIAG
jgi:hypothetical protein